jgi:hypothetical protein
MRVMKSLVNGARRTALSGRWAERKANQVGLDDGFRPSEVSLLLFFFCYFPFYFYNSVFLLVLNILNLNELQIQMWMQQQGNPACNSIYSYYYYPIRQVLNM